MFSIFTSRVTEGKVVKNSIWEHRSYYFYLPARWRYGAPLTWSTGTPAVLRQEYSGFAFDPANNELHLIMGGSYTYNHTAYDVVNDTWTILPPVPSNISACNNSPTWYVNGKIYFVSAYAGGSTCGYATLEYDVASQTYSFLSNCPVCVMYGCFSSVTYNNMCYAFGVDSTGSAVVKYDPSTDTWYTLSPVPHPRGHLIASKIGTDVFVFSGTIVDKFDLTTETWTPNYDTLPFPLLHGQAIANESSQYIFLARGWYNRTYISAIYYPYQKAGVITNNPYPHVGASWCFYNGKGYIVNGFTTTGGVTYRVDIVSLP